jgi:hypothetical protein
VAAWGAVIPSGARDLLDGSPEPVEEIPRCAWDAIPRCAPLDRPVLVEGAMPAFEDIVLDATVLLPARAPLVDWPW